MANTLNQPNLLNNTGMGEINNGNIVLFKLYDGGSGSGKRVPVLSNEKPITMQSNKAKRQHGWPKASLGCCVSCTVNNNKNNRNKIDIQEHPEKEVVNITYSTKSTILSTKISNGEEKP